MVGMAGFEPTTFRSQSGRATNLRYIPCAGKSSGAADAGVPDLCTSDGAGRAGEGRRGTATVPAGPAVPGRAAGLLGCSGVAAQRGAAARV